MHPNRRPLTAAEVADAATLEEFGRNLRDWQHELKRVTSRKEAASRFEEPPPLLRGKFEKGDVADAYLAAYTLWLSQQNQIHPPEWVLEWDRTADEPWWSQKSYRYLLLKSPAAFIERNIFTIPDPVLKIRPGRPKTATPEKRREQSRERQRRFRERVKEKLKRS